MGGVFVPDVLAAQMDEREMPDATRSAPYGTRNRRKAALLTFTRISPGALACWFTSGVIALRRVAGVSAGALRASGFGESGAARHPLFRKSGRCRGASGR